MAQYGYDRVQLQHYYQNQEFEQALTYLQSVAVSTEPQYQFDLGYAYYVNEDWKAALKNFNMLHQHNPSLPAPQLYLAQLYERFMNYDSALYYYTNLTRLFPERYKYWQNAADQWTQLKQNDSALYYIKKSYLLNPKSGSVVLDYAIALKKKKLVIEAEKIVTDFLRTDSSNPAIISQKVGFSFDAKRYDETIFWGEVLRAQNAITPNAYSNLAFSYLNINKPDSAISIYEWLKLQNLAGEPVIYCAALAYGRLKNYTKSNFLLDDCLKNNIMPDAITYFRDKAENYEAVKNYTRAAALYDTSYYIFKNPIDLYLAGKVYDEFLKNRTKAIAYYKKFLAVRPDPFTNDEKMIIIYIKKYLSL